MTIRLTRLAACALLPAIFMPHTNASTAKVPGSGPVASTPITIGVAHEIASVPLNERRIVNVVLPASYEKGPAKRYPVLYVIDGGVDQDLLHVSGAVHLGALWGRSAEAIIVGLETKDRRRELTGTTRDPKLLKRYPTAGASRAFREFIAAEVKPLVERLYRTNGRSVALGESLAGLFIVESYLEDQALFDGYAAIDPSLWWDKEALSKTAASRPSGGGASPRLFLAIAREQSEEPAAAKRLLAALHAKGRSVCLTVRPDLSHATIYQQVIPQALQTVLPPTNLPSAAFGFSTRCSDPL